MSEREEERVEREKTEEEDREKDLSISVNYKITNEIGDKKWEEEQCLLDAHIRLVHQSKVQYRADTARYNGNEKISYHTALKQ